MPKAKLLTPVLRYWNLKSQPFDDHVLKEDDLHLFVNREYEVRKLHNSITNVLCGVYGGQGNGKSSVLHKVAAHIKKDGYAVVFIEMTGMSQTIIFREILGALLRAISDKLIKLDGRIKLNAEEELDRVQYSVTYSKAQEASGEVGASFVANISANVNRSQVTTFELPQHSEETAIELIQKIIRGSKEPFVVIVDNFERLFNVVNNEDHYFKLVTQFARTVDSFFSDHSTSFLITLDKRFADRIQDGLPGNEEASSFSFGQLVEIGFFPPQHMQEIIRTRLGFAGWPGSVSEFIDLDAFWSLVLATKGHPRRAFAVLREAMELIAGDKKERRLTNEVLRGAISQCSEQIDQKDFEILSYLNQHGPQSSSDDAWEQDLDLQRTAIRKRLEAMVEKGVLRRSSVIEGRTTKILYMLTPLDFN